MYLDHQIIHFYFIFTGYKFVMDPKKFENASKHCKEIGGELALPTSEESNRALVDLAKAGYDLAIKNGAPPLTHFETQIPIWINVQTDKDNKPPGDLVYTNWKAGGPDGEGNECVRINTIGKKPYLWNTKRCNAEFPYVCQFRGKIVV